MDWHAGKIGGDEPPLDTGRELDWFEIELLAAKRDRPPRIVPVSDSFSWREDQWRAFAISGGEANVDDEE